MIPYGLSEKKEFFNTFLLVIFYATGFYCLQFFLYRILAISLLPSTENLYKWDSCWYKSIADQGYHYNPDGPCNLAFFPLFPMVWKISHLGVWGISVLNILFFATGFSIICDILKPNIQNKILWLSIPTVYYTFIPYSEALFFLLASTAIWSIKKKKIGLTWVSIILLSMTRSTSILLAPAFFVMCLLSGERKDWLKNIYIYLRAYLPPLLIGFGLLTWYQYSQTGVWFVYFLAQKKWQHILALPTLPFTTFAGPPTLWLCALAVFIGIFSFLFIIFKFTKWLFKNETENEIVMVSCGYLVITVLFVILYSPIWGETATNLWGIFRYIFINPFFYVFLFHFTNNYKYTWRHFLFIFILTNLIWLTFGSYLHILTFLYFMTNTVIIFFFMLHANKLSWPILILTAFNIFIQIELMQQFFGKGLCD